jgi:hypothetical protein
MVVENLPCAQSIQFACIVLPKVAANVPAIQFWHVAGLVALKVGEYLPRSHSTQSVSSSLPVVARNVPDPHEVHESAVVAPELTE